MVMDLSTTRILVSFSTVTDGVEFATIHYNSNFTSPRSIGHYSQNSNRLLFRLLLIESS
jgi:hypothetical protein